MRGYKYYSVSCNNQHGQGISKEFDNTLKQN